MSKILTWIKARWKLLVGFIGALIAAMTFYMRSRTQKSILKKANDAHKAETEANDKARKDLTDGLDKLRDETAEALKAAADRAEEKKKKLEKEKQDLIDKTIEDGDVAKKLADRIGADFIEIPKE